MATLTRVALALTRARARDAWLASAMACAMATRAMGRARAVARATMDRALGDAVRGRDGGAARGRARVRSRGAAERDGRVVSGGVRAGGWERTRGRPGRDAVLGRDGAGGDGDGAAVLRRRLGIEKIVEFGGDGGFNDGWMMD